MDNNINLDDLKKKIDKSLEKDHKKREEIEKWKKRGEWLFNKAYENKEKIAFAAPVIIFMGKAFIKRSNLHKAETLKNNYCYDRSLGHYWQLKRPLTNAEWIEIDKRKRRGDRLADILEEFRVLK